MRKLSKIYTLDIETDIDGDIVDIGFYDGENVKYFQNWEQFVDELGNIENSAMIYAHNGGGFDYVNFLIHCFTRNLKFEAMMKQSKIFCFWLIDKPHIKFVDSFNILPTSLEKVSQSFSELQKIEIEESNYLNMRLFKERERDLYYRYLDRDCVSLYQAICKIQLLVNEIAMIGNLPLSIGGVSMRLFNKAFLDHKIQRPSKTEKEFTFNGYVGGRCEYLGFGNIDKNGYYHSVNGYDYNSHYPAQMISCNYPVRRGVYTNNFVRSMNGEILCGMYSAKFRQNFGRIPILQTIDGKYEFDGYGIYTNHELNYIEKYGGKVECLGGYYYSETSNIFDSFVNFFYEKRLEAQEKNESAKAMVYKLVLNNLYGKFGQRDTVESLRILTREEVDAALINGVDLNEFYRLDDNIAFYDIKESKQCFTSFPAIAAMITANGRLALCELLESCKNPIYCDTDSVHCQDELPNNLVGNDLGELKIEFYNAYARYGGKKSYEIVGEKMRQKGIPNKSLNESFFDELFRTGLVSKQFQRPLLLKSAIRKIGVHSPSKFTDFTRTISRDQSLKERIDKEKRKINVDKHC